MDIVTCYESLYTAFGLAMRFIGRFVTARDYTIQITVTTVTYARLCPQPRSLSVFW
jgi:hypothetical protein